MNTVYIPSPDTIPVAWGWFQFLLLLTFPLHILAMNAMLGGLGIGIIQQLRGGKVGGRLAHRIAVALPLVIAFVVNLGVAPLLFLQVLYGQFIYTSSVLMGLFWIMVVPVLIVAYYAAYLYDFKYFSLGRSGVWVAVAVFLLLCTVGFFLTNNMLLMTLPEQFSRYFDHMAGTMLISGDRQFLPRYLHMLCGALAIGGLFVALLGRFRAADDPELADHALKIGMNTFVWFTFLNFGFGTWYLLAIERETMLMFMGKNILATVCFSIALLLALFVFFAGMKKKLLLTFLGTGLLVYLMSFMRAWVRSSYLQEYFTLGDLQMVGEYSPLLFFLITLVAGCICIAWMLKLTAGAMQSSSGKSGFLG